MLQSCVQCFGSRYAAVRSVCCTVLYPAASWSQAANRRDVTRRLDLRRRRMWDDSFRRVSCTSSNLVSVPSSSRYMLSCPRLAFWFRCRCQPTSLFDRTLRLNTDHIEGGHVLESIHVDRIYLHSCVCAAVVASLSSSWSVASMVCTGRQGSASSCQQYRWNCGSLL